MGDGDDDPQQPRASGEELDILLTAHEQLREEIRGHGKRKSRRFLATFSITGVVAGYVFTSGGDPRLAVVFPIILAFQYLSDLSSRTYVANLAAILCRIEERINCPGMEYEYYYGGFRVQEHPLRTQLDGPPVEKTSLPIRATNSLLPWKQTDGTGRQEESLTHHRTNQYVRRGMQVIAIVSYLLACATGVLGFWSKKLAGASVPDIIPQSPLAAWTVLGILLLLYLTLAIIVWLSYVEYRIEQATERDILRNNDGTEYDGILTDQESSPSEGNHNGSQTTGSAND